MTSLLMKMTTSLKKIRTTIHKMIKKRKKTSNMINTLKQDIRDEISA